MGAGPIFLLAMTAAAADKPSTEKPKETLPAAAPSAAPAEPAPAAAPASTETLTADQVIDAVEKADRELKSLHTKFRQRMRVPGYGLDQAGDGEIWFQKEKRFRVEQSAPQKQIIASDGTTIWIYMPETNQLIEQNWEAFEKGQMVSRGLTQFGSYGDLREKYSVSASSRTEADGTRSYLVVLAPKDPKDLPFRLELTVKAPEFVPVKTKLLMNEMEVTTELIDAKINPELDPKLFEFKPPADAVRMKMGP